VQILLQIVPIHARYPSRDARWKRTSGRARENLGNVNGRPTAERITLKVAGTGPRTDGGENCWAKVTKKRSP